MKMNSTPFFSNKDAIQVGVSYYYKEIQVSPNYCQNVIPYKLYFIIFSYIIMIKWNNLRTEAMVNKSKPDVDKSVLLIYFEKIFESLSELDQKSNCIFLSRDSFEQYFNLPLIICDRVFNALSCETENQLQKNEFISGMTNLYSRDIEVNIYLSFEFLDCYKNKLIQRQDIKLLLYYFHSISNRSPVNQIDSIISKSLNEANLMTYDAYVESLKTNSDLFFLLLFYFRIYQPFNNAILKYCWKCQKDTQIKDDVKSKDHASYDIAGPSDCLLLYLKNEFEFDIETTFFDSDTMEEKGLNIINSSVGDYAFIKGNLIIQSKHGIYPLVNSYMESSLEGVDNQITYVNRLNCKLQPLEIKLNSDNDVNAFSDLFRQFNPVRNIEDYYSLGQTIHTGNFSIIKLALRKAIKTDPHKIMINTNSKPLIAKIISKSIPCGYKWDKDISKFLMKNTHPNVINCIDIFENKKNLYLIFEYHYEGSLSDYLMNNYELLQSSEISLFISQILSGLVFLRQFGIIHRDIKPENIMMADNSTLKINDFGFGRVLFSSETANESYGSLCYASPEILLNKSYTHKTDLWSLGVISFYLQFGKLPFDDDNGGDEEYNKIAKKIINCDYSLPNNEEDTINKCTLAFKAIESFLKPEYIRVDLYDFISTYVNKMHK